jgi:hypothetical protein
MNYEDALLEVKSFKSDHFRNDPVFKGFCDFLFQVYIESIHYSSYRRNYYDRERKGKHGVDKPYFISMFINYLYGTLDRGRFDYPDKGDLRKGPSWILMDLGNSFVRAMVQNSLDW